MRIIVTGGSGFIGSSLIKYLVKHYKNIEILSIDNYLSGSKSNEIINDKVKYINDTTVNIKKYNNFLPNYVFHFGEYSRISQSFEEPGIVFESNLNGTFRVIEYCRKMKCKLIYSASSAILGNDLKDQHNSPYTWSKGKNVELIKNYGKWYKLNYTIVYFYNVYGNGQIKTGKYSTVIGIFEEQFKNNKALTVVLPGTQRRDFTHIDDTIKGIIVSAFKGSGDGYYIRRDREYSIIDVAKLFKSKYIMIESKRGDRKRSSGSNGKLKELGWNAERDLERYIEKVIGK